MKTTTRRPRLAALATTFMATAATTPVRVGEDRLSDGEAVDSTNTPFRSNTGIARVMPVSRATASVAPSVLLPSAGVSI